MEMLSVSLIMPFMEAVMDPDTVMSNPIVMRVCDILDIGNNRTFLVVLSLSLAAVYILKNIFLLFQTHIQNRFVYNNLFMTQARLLRSFLNRPYEFYLNSKTGDILRVIQTDTTDVFSLLIAVLSLISELIVSAILAVTLFVIAPTITMGMFALMTIMLVVILKIIRPVLRKLGQTNLDAYTKMNQWLIQMLQGIKEIKIMRKEGYFEKQYEENGEKYAKANTLNTTLNLVPRFLIEAVAMSSIFIVIAFMINNGSNIQSIIPMLSSIAAAAIRLLPAVNRISISMTNMAYAEIKLDKMIENLNEADFYGRTMEEPELSDNHDSTVSNLVDIEMRGVSYKYPTGNKNVLTGASMRVIKGQSVGIIGPSGAGKSTAIDILLGLLSPQEGEVCYNGKSIKKNPEEWLSQIGYIPQSVFMIDGSVRENVAFGEEKNKIDDEKVWTALKKASLYDYIKTLPEGIDSQIGERGVNLSGGQRQRIAIARALYNDPPILFFDEATSALDNETEAAIMESIDRFRGTKTMIIIAHRLTTIEGCDVIFRVDSEKITVETIMSDNFDSEMQ